MNLLKYSNGVGHLIMSLFFGTVGLIMTIYPALDPSVRGVGIGILLTVTGAWFVPGAAKQVAYQVEQVTTASAVTPTADHVFPQTPAVPLPIILPNNKVGN